MYISTFSFPVDIAHQTTTVTVVGLHPKPQFHQSYPLNCRPPYEMSGPSPYNPHQYRAYPPSYSFKTAPPPPQYQRHATQMMPQPAPHPPQMAQHPQQMAQYPPQMAPQPSTHPQSMHPGPSAPPPPYPGPPPVNQDAPPLPTKN